MTSERKKRLSKGIAADGISQFSQMFIRFAEVPLLLYFWGVELYGEWLIITALPTYLGISDFGFTHVTARQVVMQVAKGDKNEALATYQSSAILVGLTSFVIALLFFLLIWLLPIEDMFHFDKLSEGQLLTVAALLGVKIMVSMQSGMLGSALQATGHYPLFILIMAGISIGEFLLLVFILAMGGEPVMAAGAMLASSLAGMLVFYLMVRHFSPWFYFGLKSFRLEIIRKLARPAFAALSFPTSQALNFQGTRLIIGSVLGPAAVALFVPHRQLAGFVSRTNIIGQSIKVELGLAYGANDMASFKKLSLQSIQVLLWGAMVAAIAIGIAAWFIFPYWTGEKLQFNPLLFTILLLTTVTDVVWRAAFHPASATNRHEYLAKIVLFTNIVMLLLMYVLCFYSGLIGAALALLAGVFLTLIYAVKNAILMTNIKSREFLLHMLRPPTFLLSRKRLKSVSGE